MDPARRPAGAGRRGGGLAAVHRGVAARAAPSAHLGCVLPRSVGGSVMSFWGRVDWLLEHRKLVRRVLMLWLMLLVTAAVVVFLYVLLVSPSAITAPVASVLVAVVGLSTVTQAVYTWERGTHDG